MKEQVTRRNFFKLLGGGVALVIAPSIAVAEKIINIPVEFGWTWYVDKNKVPTTLSEIVTKTLRENTQKICENIGQNNSLLVKLKDGQKLKLNIEQISEKEQNDRILLRTENRRVARLQNKIDFIKNHPSNDLKFDARRIEQYMQIIRYEPLYGLETEEEKEIRRKLVQDNQNLWLKSRYEPL